MSSADGNPGAGSAGADLGGTGGISARVFYHAADPEAVVEEAKGYIGFDARDAANLRELGPLLEGALPGVIDRFYAEILRHPGAAGILSGPEQVRRLRTKLDGWLRSLFCGEYGREYWRGRSDIGRTHVRAGLAQHYMFAAMEVIWQELRRATIERGVPQAETRLQSLHKLLTLELMVMLQTYCESYSRQVWETERIALQERLSRAEHLAQIGQLAASLAHEVKNPLAGISSAIQVLRDAMPAGDPHQPILGEILRQIDRLDGTVEDLLVYAKPKQPRLRECDLNAVVERVLGLLSQQPVMQGIRLEHVAGRGLPTIEADCDQMEQVLLNLLMNAAHASRRGSTVWVTTSAAEEGLILQVEDEGHGMTEAVRRRALEPFFTTKAQGTGLGLAICNQIVRAHGGAIDIRSAVGRGTTVTVYLPFRGREGARS